MRIWTKKECNYISCKLHLIDEDKNELFFTNSWKLMQSKNSHLKRFVLKTTSVDNLEEVFKEANEILEKS